MNTTTAPQTTYTDVHDTTAAEVKVDLDYRVFVEIDNKKIIVAYKPTLLAAKRAYSKIGRDHESNTLSGWGWETKDKYNASRW